MWSHNRDFQQQGLEARTLSVTKAFVSRRSNPETHRAICAQDGEARRRHTQKCLTR